MDINQNEPDFSSKLLVSNKQDRDGQNNSGTNMQKHSTVIIEKNSSIIVDYNAYLMELKKSGTSIRSDHNQPSSTEHPPWYEADKFSNIKNLYERHMMAINFAHLSGLLLLVRVDAIFNTLAATGESSSVAKLFKRYYNTLKHVKRWYEGDLFDSKGDAYKSLLIVRGMHNKVSEKFNSQICTNVNDEKVQSNQKSFDSKEKDVIDLVPAFGSKSTCTSPDTVHISQYDLMMTQFAFIGFIVVSPDKIGLIDDFNRGDLENLVHFWRVIGYYLGLKERYNLCSYDLKDIVGLCKAFMELEYRKSLNARGLEQAPGVMSLNIVRALKFIPLITFYGMMRHLYEIMGHQVSEVEHKRTRYSNLSYYLINLVMTRLLAYRPLRWFNNGLIRLSIYLVGKYEQCFFRHLDSKYGAELRT